MTTPEFARVTETGIYGFRGDYFFLSNMYVDEHDFCVENHYQAAKLLPEFTDDYKRILAATPHQSKRLGREIPPNKRRPDWNLIQLPTMVDLLTAKFTNRKTAALLMATGAKLLEETNDWHDNFWGNCVCLTLRKPSYGIKQSCRAPGANNLGLLHMANRTVLQAALCTKY